MREITTDAAPASIGPFSQAIVDDGQVFVSGQGPVDPETDAIVDGDVSTQTEQTLANVQAILRAADCTLDDVVKATVYVTDMDHYDAVNEVYETHFTEPYPARSAVEVSDLPIEIDVEIEVIASAQSD